MTKSKGGNGYTSYSGKMLVYPQFVETIALLREYGFDMEETLTADDVEMIRVRKNVYSGSSRYVTGSVPYIYMDDEAETDAAEYTDKEQIQQILDSIVSDGLSWQVSGFANYLDRQYYVEVRYDTEDSTYSDYSFIEGKIPDFVKLSKK